MTAIFETCCALHNQLLEYDGWEFDESLTDIPENIHDGAFLGHDEFMDSEIPLVGYRIMYPTVQATVIVTVTMADFILLRDLVNVYVIADTYT